jgi:tetratricopeptide (TPR) repeat protein
VSTVSGPPDDLRARALELLLQGDTAGAITDLKAYLAEEADDERAWLELGAAYAAINHWREAADALRKAVDLDGEVVDARLAYGRALARIDKLDDAAFQLLQAAKIAPDDARVLKDLGIVFYDKRLYDKAALWLTRACVAAPTDARAAYALGLAQEARHDPGAAVAAYSHAVQLDPRLVDARKTLADALASMGEHERAIAELSAVLELDRANEQAAHNRDVLVRALDEMRARRLLGKTESELQASALVQEGQFKRKGRVPAEAFTAHGAAGAEVIRYGAPMVELYVVLDEGPTIDALMLVLTHPEKAAAAKDEAFKVTVIGQDGTSTAVNFATAVSLTFLREALGCPMTNAGEIYARLLGGATVDWGQTQARFATVPRPDKPSDLRHGILVMRRPA